MNCPYNALIFRICRQACISFKLGIIHKIYGDKMKTRNALLMLFALIYTCNYVALSQEKMLPKHELIAEYSRFLSGQYNVQNEKDIDFGNEIQLAYLNNSLPVSFSLKAGFLWLRKSLKSYNNVDLGYDFFYSTYLGVGYIYPEFQDFFPYITLDFGLHFSLGVPLTNTSFVPKLGVI